MTATALLPRAAPARAADGSHLIIARAVDGRRSLGAWPWGLRPADGLLPAALVLWVTATASIDPQAMNDWGLFPALPVRFFVAVGLVVASITFVLLDARASTVRLGLHLVALVLVLHGTVPAVFSLPNYPWVYKHIGVTSYANLYGGFDASIDVYHNWPGFFAISALFTKIAGVDSPLAYARWAPVYFNVLMSLELSFAFRALPVRRRERWLALFLFVGANWVGQDYFAPQAMAFVLSLAALGVGLHWLLVRRPSDLVWAERVLGRLLRLVWRNARQAEDLVAAPSSRAAWLCALGVIFGVFAAVVVTHVLSPFMILFGLALVAGAGKLRPRWTVAAFAAMAGAFLAAHYFSLPHNGFMDAQDLMEVFGHPFGSNPTGAQAQPGRKWTALGAPLLILLIWGLGTVGAVRRVRAGRPTLVIAVLAASPSLTLLLSGYGGEAILRIYLFSLPWAALLAACALEPGLSRRRRRAPIWIGLMLSFVALLFMSAFYGSEELYQSRPAEVRAAQYFYERAEPGSVLITAAQQFPEKVSGRYGSQFIPSLQLLTTLDENAKPFGFHRRMLGTRDVPKVAEFIEYFAGTRRGAAYLVLSTGQETYARVLGLSPPGALRSLGRALGRSPDWTVFYRNADATIYRFARRAVTPRVHVPQLPSANRRWIDWGELAIAVAGFSAVGSHGRKKMTSDEANGQREMVTDGAVLLEFLSPSDTSSSRRQRGVPERWSTPLESQHPAGRAIAMIETPTEPDGPAEPDTRELVLHALSAPADRETARLELSRRAAEWSRLTELLVGVDARLHPEAIRLLADAWGGAGFAQVRAQLADPWPPIRSAALTALAVEPDDVPHLLRTLADDLSAQVRVEAVRALAEAAERDQLSALMQALSDPEPDVREAAVVALPVAGQAIAIDALLAAADDPDERVRVAARRRLASADDWVVWLVLRTTEHFADFCALCEAVGPERLDVMARIRLASPDPDDRRVAIQVLRRAGTSDAEPLLTAAVTDRDPEVRRAAVAGLSGQTTAVETVALALRDPDRVVRCAAVAALATMEHDTATDALVAALADPDPDVREAASSALVGRASPGLVRRLGAMFSSANAASVGGALLGMGPLGEKVLTAAVGEPPPDRAAAAAGLLRERDGVMRGLEDLGSVDADQRLRAVETLGRLDIPEAVDRLISALSDPWPPIRSRAVQYLGLLTDERGLDAVRGLLSTEQDPGVLDEARRVVMDLPSPV